ncbi:MAG: hypothetical protein VZQ98_09250 [Bacteroidales bacterium]|jgi:hypothetical protein|nr:hypothetical protein [Bacteroidales bacterium]
MSDSDILALATQRGYTIGAESDTTEEIINDFLDEQELKYPFTQTELEELTVNEIEAIASARGYTITETLKADIITEFLSLQNA